VVGRDKNLVDPFRRAKRSAGRFEIDILSSRFETSKAGRARVARGGAGFRSGGLYPLRPSRSDQYLFAPSVDKVSSLLEPHQVIPTFTNDFASKLVNVLTSSALTIRPCRHIRSG
jgi:hypothetical protein